MSSPMRLSSELVDAATRESQAQRRSVPKQIEHWAALGKAVENIIGYADIIDILSGQRRLTLSPIKSVTASAKDVFNALEQSRKIGALSKTITSADVYYETSRSQPGFIDQVDAATGVRKTGQFRNGEFKAIAK
ncbi:hypothetical protein [Moraxella sp.]|uniref:TA system antitoxin ParD family protein n=1 Tax=Moraxella sp. TaxID=479 RepID=UPI00261C6083|nr:hypothetical protein [Moraxella sp.]MCP3896467.1 hypothetical protein [Moraxella sp.]